MQTSSVNMPGPPSESNRDLLPWQWLLLVFCLGLLAAGYPVPALSGAGLVAAVHRWHSRGHLPLTLLALAFVAGWLAAWGLRPSINPEPPSWMTSRAKVDVTASIERVRFKPENRLQLILDEVRFRTGQGDTGLLPAKIVWTWEGPEQCPAPGQTVQGTFRIKPVRGFLNPGTWDTRWYWGLRGVAYRMYSRGPLNEVRFDGQPGFFWKLRQDLRTNILEETGPGDGQGLLLALVMGDRSRLSYDRLDLVRRASLAHSLALSGLHLGFIASLGFGLAWILGLIRPSIFLSLPRQKLSLLLALPLVLAYLWLGQARPSLLRASLMFLFWGILLIRGRGSVLLDGLMAALGLIVLMSPLAVYDLGLQLSVVAVAGIVLLWPGFWSWYQSVPLRPGIKRVLAPAAGLLAVSLIANAVLLPLVVWNFGQVSPHLVLNLLWLPILGWLVLPLGFVGLGISLVPGLKSAAGLLFSASSRLLETMVSALDCMDQHGWLEVLVPLRPRWPEMIGYWLLIGLVVMSWKRPRRLPLWTIVLAASLFIAGRAGPVLSQNDCLRLQLLDVGQGQAVLITSPKGHRVLIDGGGSWNPDFDLGRFAVSPALTWGAPPRLDTVILSHDDFDHLRGLFYLLENYSVGRFVYNGVWPSGQDGERLRRIVSRRDLPVQTCLAGDRIALDSGFALDVLHPGAENEFQENNDQSLILRLVQGKKGLALIPGDVEQAGIRRLMESEQQLSGQVLVLPHHGSRSSLSPELYEAVDPDCALVSCGSLNVFHFPHQQVQTALQERDVPLFSTAELGSVSVQWEDERMELEAVHGGTVRKGHEDQAL
jgi:competence protein ComEC